MEGCGLSLLWPHHAAAVNSISSSLAAEIESNTCPICFELMKSPDYSPMLLSPCGHTFCAKCVAVHTAVHRKKARIEGGPVGPPPCPYCRQKILSQTLNISLQRMITNILSLQKTLQQADVERVGFSERHSQAQIRCQILHDGRQETSKTKQRLEGELAATNRILEQLQLKQKDAQERLQMVKLEHQMVVSEVQDTESKLAMLQRAHAETIAKSNLIQASLFALEGERDKLRLLLQDWVGIGDDCHSV